MEKIFKFNSRKNVSPNKIKVIPIFYLINFVNIISKIFLNFYSVVNLKFSTQVKNIIFMEKQIFIIEIAMK